MSVAETHDEMLTIPQVIDQTESRFQEIGPVGVSYASEKGFVIQHLKNNDYLMRVAQQNPQSLMQAMANVAAVGLSLNPAEKLAYLIPRSVRQGDRYVTKIFYEPSYMGLIRLATDSGSIRWVQADVVYEGEEFVMGGVDEKPLHRRNPFQRSGKIVGTYCVAKTSEGDYLTEAMSREEIDGIMERSESVKKARQSGKSPTGPWVTDYAEQAKKTVIRRAFKTWPRTKQNQRLAKAINISNENEGFEPLVTAPSLSQPTGDDKAYFDQLIERDNNLDMYVMQQTVNSGLFANLYNSFEKGTVTRYKRVVDTMLEKGHQEFADWLLMYQEAKANGDDLGLQEIRDQVSTDAYTLLEKRA